MYVCLCNAVSDRDIREAVEEGVQTMGELRAVLPVASQCGRCGRCARQCLQECLEDTDQK